MAISHRMLAGIALLYGPMREEAIERAPQVAPTNDITPEEAEGLARGLMDFAEGRTRPLYEIEKELAEFYTRKD